MTGLNLDVLLVICGFLTDVSTVLSLSLTCATLRPFAVERRLSMRPVTIDCAKSLRDLYNFIFVDEKARGPHIHTITITERDPGRSLAVSEDQVVDCMLAVLAYATRLRTLFLHVPQHWGPSSSLLHHPRFLTAVSDMTSLQEFNIAAAMVIAHKVIGTTRSALKTLRHIKTHGKYRDSRFAIAPHLASTLKEIELPYRSFLMAFNASMSLPAVRSATVTAVWELRQLRLDMFLAVVPNLDRTLILRDGIPVHQFRDVQGARLLALRLREENREAQKTRSWAALGRVAASPLALYVLGLTCPIRHLSLVMALEDCLLREGDSLRTRLHTRAVLPQEYAPTHVALVDIKLPYGFSMLKHWPKCLFPEAAAARLTHLVLDAQYTNIESDPQPRYDSDALWDAELDTLLAALSSLRLRLTHLRIVFRCDIVHARGPFSTAMYYGMRCFKFDRLVAALPRAVPSLTHIFIATSGRAETTTFGRAYAYGRLQRKETWQVSRAWRVRRPAACARTAPGASVETPVHDIELEELTEKEREAGIDREELRATEKPGWIGYSRE